MSSSEAPKTWLSQDAHDRLQAELDALIAARPKIAAEISARRDDKIVFQLPLIAVVDQVNAGIDRRVFDTRVSWHIRAPLCRIVTDEVMGLAWQFLKPGARRRRVSADELHP